MFLKLPHLSLIKSYQYLIISIAIWVIYLCIPKQNNDLQFTGMVQFAGVTIVSPTNNMVGLPEKKVTFPSFDWWNPFRIPTRRGQKNPVCVVCSACGWKELHNGFFGLFGTGVERYW